jgi:hypothetical protein
MRAARFTLGVAVLTALGPAGCALQETDEAGPRPIPECVVFRFFDGLAGEEIADTEVTVHRGDEEYETMPQGWQLGPARARYVTDGKGRITVPLDPFRPRPDSWNPTIVFVPNGYRAVWAYFRSDMKGTRSEDHLTVDRCYEGGGRIETRIHALRERTVSIHDGSATRTEPSGDTELFAYEVRPKRKVTALRLSKKRIDDIVNTTMESERVPREQIVTYLGEHYAEVRVQEDAECFGTRLYWCFADTEGSYTVLTCLHYDDGILAGATAIGRMNIEEVNDLWNLEVVGVADAPPDYPSEPALQALRASASPLTNE